MKKILLVLFSLIFIFVTPTYTLAQEEMPQEVQLEEANQQQQISKPEQFYLARVKEIIEQGNNDIGGGMSQPYQKLKITILNGDERGKEIELNHGSMYSITDDQKVKVGGLVVLTKSFEGGEVYYIADLFRLHILGIVLVIVILVWAILGRGRNLGMLVAMLGMFGIGYYYLIPEMVKSVNPYLTIMLAALAMLAILVFVGYGINRKTLLVFISTGLTTLLVLVISYGMFKLTGYTGTQTDKATFYLSNSIFEPAALKNIFLSTVVITTLGITSYLANKQVNLVEEIMAQTKKVKLHEMYKRILINPDNSFSPLMAIIFVGYLATNLGVIWLFRVNPNLPVWVTFNSEYLFSEVMNLLISMVAVVLVIPITTHFVLTFLPKKK